MSAKTEGCGEKIFEMQMDLLAFSIDLPVLGFFPSIPLALSGAVELILGVVGTIFLGIASLFTSLKKGEWHEKCVKLRNEAIDTSKMGATFLAAGLGNIVTAGLGAYVVCKFAESKNPA